LFKITSRFFQLQGLKLVFAPYPDDVNAFVEDQAIWFHKPLEEKTNPDGENSNNKVSQIIILVFIAPYLIVCFFKG